MQSENLPDEANPDISTYQPTHEQIAKLAYRLWEKGGEQHGADKDNWRTAEKILIEEHHKRHHRHHGANSSTEIPPGPHTNLEGGNSPMNQNREDEPVNQEDESVNGQLNSENDLGDEDVDPAARQDSENAKQNKGEADNTEDANPMSTDKSNQPPIGGSTELPDDDSPTHSQNVGPNQTPGGNGDPASGNPLSTGADNLAGEK